MKGYGYYQPPPEVKYRYPAPGSSPHDRNDHPNLYKKHWKTPFRQSPYNIQKIQKPYTDEHHEVYVSAYPVFDPTDAVDRGILRE